MVGRIREVGDPRRPALLSEDPDTIGDEPKLAFFLDYWRHGRGDRALPLRTSFNPKDAKPYLGWVFVADALENFVDFRYRVVGSRVCDYFLGNGTGKTVREAFAGAPSKFVEGTLSLYRHACRAKIPLRLQTQAATYNHIVFPASDSLYLPLSSDGCLADRIVAIFTFNDQSFLGQRRSLIRLAAHVDRDQGG